MLVHREVKFVTLRPMLLLLLVLLLLNKIHGFTLRFIFKCLKNEGGKQEGEDACTLGCPAKTCFLKNQKTQPVFVVFGSCFEGSQKDFQFKQLLGGAQDLQKSD